MENILQRSFAEDTSPSISHVLTYIKEAEAEIDSKEWGRYTQVDEYVDASHEIVSFQWMYTGFFAQIFYPQHTNIVRIIEARYNVSGSPSGNPSWKKVEEGPAEGSSFVQLRKAVLKEQLGYALLFYNNTPSPGPLRLKLTYEYGMNIDSALLQEYVGKIAGMSTLLALASSENVNINTDKGPYAALYKSFEMRTDHIVENIFPKKVRKAYIFPSIM